jgi:hypothetical protein
MRCSTGADPALNGTASENVSIRPLPIGSAAATIPYDGFRGAERNAIRVNGLSVIQIYVTLATVAVGNCRIDGPIAIQSATATFRVGRSGWRNAEPSLKLVRSNGGRLLLIVAADATLSVKNPLSPGRARRQ